MCKPGRQTGRLRKILDKMKFDRILVHEYLYNDNDNIRKILIKKIFTYILVVKRLLNLSF